MKRSGNNWSLEYDDGVAVGVFEEGMPLDAFGTEAYPAFEAIIGEHREDIVGTADLVELEDPFGDGVLDIWEGAANESAQLPDYRRAALVAEGIKRVSRKKQLRVPDAEIETFEDHERAVEWARGER